MLSKEFLAFAHLQAPPTVCLGKRVFIFVLPLRTLDQCTDLVNKANTVVDTINKANANNRENLRKLDSILSFPQYLESTYQKRNNEI